VNRQNPSRCGEKYEYDDCGLNPYAGPAQFWPTF
jgi:hypothetical protein